MSSTNRAGALLLAVLAIACGGNSGGPQTSETPAAPSEEETKIQKLLDTYTTVRLTTELSVLSDNERQMIPLLIDAAAAMDEVFWLEAYGDRPQLMASISDPRLARYAEINYGPWDRLDGNKPFLPGVGEKPKGATYYPTDMTVEEFEEAVRADPEGGKALKSIYTVVRRDGEGELTAVPYSRAFADQHQRAAEKLRAAAALAEDAGLREYLELRALALLSDEYQKSDLAWLDMKTNTLDIVIGPIETYEDQLFGYKASHEAYVLVKDQEWSRRLERYAALLPDLQKGLPVPDAYKAETPGTDSDLNAYDVLYYAGDCNAGSKTIAINLPNDEEVQLQKGTRRLQLKNAMRAKFDQILVPIAGVLIDPEQRSNIVFDAFFANTMFHEVAHGLGIKKTLDGKDTVRGALKELASSLEEGKADVLGLYMVTRLNAQGELGDAKLTDNYVTFLASIFRSIRFGSASAHGVANLIRFNFFQEMGAFTRDAASGTYRIDFDKMQTASDALSEKILRLQGDGDYEGVVAFINQYGNPSATLTADLERLASAGIPVDVVFEQGKEVLGL